MIKGNATYKNIMKPVGTYKKVYDNFINAVNVEKAMGFALRLQKGNLLYWLVNEWPDVEFESNIKKPEALELVQNVLESTLTGEDDAECDGAQDQDKQDQDKTGPDTEERGNSTEEVKTEQELDKDPEYIGTWDESGSIEKDQLRELVRLKTLLEAEGILAPNKWVDHVNNAQITRRFKNGRNTNIRRECN
jgi:hypothetical protein